MRHQTTYYKQAGSSLVEAMLACTLGLFLISGLVQVYLTVEKTSNLQQAINTIQENARFSVHFLNDNLRMAGYANCNTTAPLTNIDLALRGYTNALPAFLQGKVAPGTHSLVVGHCVLQDNHPQFKQIALFIGASSRKTALGKTIFSLYEMPVDGNKRELVSNVDNMRISYGISPANRDEMLNYVTAEQVTDWAAVRAVDIALLFSSELPVLPQPEADEFAGIALTKSRFLHREWDTYVKLREL